jgi:hypothetical protein
MKKYIQECETIEDFEALGKTVTNMCEAEYITRVAAKKAGEPTRYWMRQFCERNFARFSNCQMYQILMGTEDGDKRQYYYVPNPF